MLHDGECITTGRSLWRAEDWRKNEGNNTPFFLVQDHFEAEKWNEDGWGIYWTVNELDGDRKQENLKRIISWAIDFDTGSKEEQANRVRRFGLIPSLVIESARGYHVYYDAIDGTKENYNKILTGLCTLLGADQGAKGVNRILRAPFYNHWKDKENPFAVRIEDMNDTKYKESEMLCFIAMEEERLKPKSRFSQQVRKFKIEKKGDGFFERVSQINCHQALRVLSGTEAVKGERYRFKDQGNGKITVYVDEKGANVWIDSEGKIGSCDKGGPTIYQWLQWFGHNHKTIEGYLKQYFGEVFT